MSDVLKARREVFTLLHYGLDLLKYNAPGGIRERSPLDGGVELAALCASLRPLPSLCRLDSQLTTAEIHAVAKPAMTQVAAWVAPPLQISTQGVVLEKVKGVQAINDGDKALSLLSLALKMLELELNLWVDGEYQVNVIPPSTLANIFSRVPREVEAFQHGQSSVNPLTSLVSAIPSNSNLARILEASGALGKTTMLEILLDEDLQNASRWLAWREVIKKGEKVLQAQSIQLLRIHEDIFGEGALLGRKVAWFGAEPEPLLAALRSLNVLTPVEIETSMVLAQGFEGTLSELIQCGEELS